jgi:hypothetical protein
MSLSPEQFEKNLHQVLRALPDRTAPLTLEARVLAAIAQRAALPWYRRSHAAWPLAVRAGFFILAGLAAAVVIFGVGRFPLWAAAAHSLADGRVVYASVLQVAGKVLGIIPSYLIYGTLAAIGACYLTLFGVGAAAYRTFFAAS